MEQMMDMMSELKQIIAQNRNVNRQALANYNQGRQQKLDQQTLMAKHIFNEELPAI
jgi:hypothetical protein